MNAYKNLNDARLYLFKLLSLILFAGLLFSCELDLMDREKNNDLPSLKDHLLGYWTFEGNTNDLSGNGYHGILMGPSLAEDRFGDDDGAYEFNGNGDYINLGNITDLGLGGFEPYAISAWVKPGVLGGTIFSKWNGGVSAGWYLRLTDELYCSSYRNVVPWATKSARQVLPEEWVHLMTQYDGEYLTVFINGALESREKFTSHPHDKSTDVLIGALHSRNAVAGYFSGFIDELRIWNRTLTDEEIAFLSSQK